MRTPLFIFLLFLGSFCHGQVKETSGVKKIDSVGVYGQYKRTIVYNEKRKKHEINGVTLEGCKTSKLLELLGPPNSADSLLHHDTMSWTYTCVNGVFTSMRIFIIHNKVKWASWMKITYETIGFSCGGGVSHDAILPEKHGIVKLAGFPIITAKIKGKDTIILNISVTDSLLAFTDMSFTRYIESHTSYPEIEKEAGISGTVYLKFVLQKDGTACNVRLMKGVAGGPGIDREAMRVLKSLPRLKPHIEKEHATDVIYYIAIRFILRD